MDKENVFTHHALLLYCKEGQSESFVKKKKWMHLESWIFDNSISRLLSVLNVKIYLYTYNTFIDLRETQLKVLPLILNIKMNIYHINFSNEY